MPLNRQLAFEDAVKGILEQGEWSYGTTCRYRGPNNTRCAIGMLIPDDQYHEAIENMPVANERVNELISYKYGRVTRGKDDHVFLNSLQLELHDKFAAYARKFDRDMFLRDAKNFANTFNLNWNIT